MFVNHNAVGSPVGVNAERAIAAWGAAMPRWVGLLAQACDATNQRAVADRLSKSSGYVSRLINNRYPGDLAEAERQVLAVFGGEDVLCPIWASRIPLHSCISNRRRKGLAISPIHRGYAQRCPTCPNNSDRLPGGATSREEG